MTAIKYSLQTLRILSLFVLFLAFYSTAYASVLQGDQKRETLKAGVTEGTEKWRFTTGDRVTTSPAIGTDGTIYFGSNDFNLYALNSDGTEKWRFPTGNYIYSSPAIGTDGTIYVGSDDFNLYAINSNGIERWRFPTGGRITASPAIGTDGTIYIGTHDNNLYAINSDGTEKWRFSITQWIDESSPAIGADGTIYVGANDFNVYAINSDGTEKWRFTTRGRIWSSPAIGSDGAVYVGANDFNLYAINPDGTEKWRFPTGRIIASSPAVGQDGTIYVGSYDYNVYAINPDGTEKWRFPTALSVWSAPAIGADGTIYVGSVDNNFYALNPDGTEKWRFPTALSVWSPPTIGTDGTIYFGSDDSNLYAVNSNSGGPANSSWPMFHHDQLHTGSALTVTVSPVLYTLTVDKAGSGAGIVGDWLGGISCGTDCMESYTSGTVVTLTATADNDSVFDGWSGGDCSGNGDCRLIMLSDTNITAFFSSIIVVQMYTIDVTISGSGTGNVISTPAGIDCGNGTLCSATFTSGTVLELQISAGSGSRLADVSVDGNSIGPIMALTFANLSSNHTIVVDFQ